MATDGGPTAQGRICAEPTVRSWRAADKRARRRTRVRLARRVPFGLRRLGAVVAGNANANRPYSKKLNQVSLDADYALAKRQWIKGAYEFAKTTRTCQGSWISCSNAATNNEHTLRAEWRADVGQDFSARVDYAFSARRAGPFRFEPSMGVAGS